MSIDLTKKGDINITVRPNTLSLLKQTYAFILKNHLKTLKNKDIKEQLSRLSIKTNEVTSVTCSCSFCSESPEKALVLPHCFPNPIAFQGAQCAH